MALRLVIRGVVQGVGFRESMCREADRLGVKGWVRNRLDGTVEAVIEGDGTAVEAMLEWAKMGPRSAQVVDLVSEPDATLEATHEGFHRITTK